MKLSITPTPAGTGYRCECLDLPGTPPVGEGSTEAEAVALLFARIQRDMIEWWRHIPTGVLEINGVPWRREGEKPTPPAPPPAVGVPEGPCMELIGAIAGANMCPVVSGWYEIAQESWQRIQECANMLQNAVNAARRGEGAGQLAIALSDVDHWHKHCVELQGQLAAAQADNRELIKCLEKLRTDDVHQQLASLTAERDKLAQDHQALAERLRESEAQAAAMRRSLDKAKRSCKWATEADYYQACRDIEVSAGRDLLAELEAAKQRASEAEQRHADADDHIDALNETIETQRARIAELEAKVKAAEPPPTPRPGDLVVAPEIPGVRGPRPFILAVPIQSKAAEPPPAAPDIERLAKAAYSEHWKEYEFAAWEQVYSGVKDRWRAVARAVLDERSKAVAADVDRLMVAVVEYGRSIAQASYLAGTGGFEAAHEEAKRVKATVRRLAEQLAGLGAWEREGEK